MSGSQQFVAHIPSPATPIVYPGSGDPTQVFFSWMLVIYARTGNQQGVSSIAVQQTANQALTDAQAAQTAAAAAQTTANTAESAAGAAQTTANTALTNANTAQTSANTANAAVAAETARALAAEALLAPKVSPSFTGNALVGGGIGVWGHASPGGQPATPVTLADVIAVIRAYGLAA